MVTDEYVIATALSGDADRVQLPHVSLVPLAKWTLRLLLPTNAGVPGCKER